MNAQLLAICASPRRKGNCETLLGAFLEGVDRKGVTWEVVRTHGSGIGDCRACEACSRPKSLGVCAFAGDGMGELLEKFLAADGFAIATPIWFGGTPATFKAVIDRCQALWAVDHTFSKHPHDKPAALLSVGGMDLAWQDAGIRAAVHSFLASVYARCVGEVFVHNVEAAGEINEHPETLEQARDLGVKVAELILVRSKIP